MHSCLAQQQMQLAKPSHAQQLLQLPSLSQNSWHHSIGHATTFAASLRLCGGFV